MLDEARTNPHVEAAIARHGCSQPTLPGPSVPYYGQCGEDLIVNALLGAMEPARFAEGRLRYLDLGANHPVSTSNTWRLYELGHSGVLVEPIPHLAAELRRVRPRDVVLQKAVVPTLEASRVRLHLSGAHEVSSLSAEFVAHFHHGRPGATLADTVVHTLMVGATTLDAVLEEHFAAEPPDLLDVDLESMDLPVLRSLDFERFAPRVIVVEPSDRFRVEPTRRTSELLSELLRDRGYVLVARTAVNLIFARLQALQAASR